MRKTGPRINPGAEGHPPVQVGMGNEAVDGDTPISVKGQAGPLRKAPAPGKDLALMV